MISYDLRTNIGDRENNEDNIGMYQQGEEYCFALADGQQHKAHQKQNCQTDDPY